MTLKGKATAVKALAPLAFLCAVCMIPAAAFADDGTVGVTGSYQVTIPTEVSIDEQSGTDTLNISGELAEQRTLTIGVSSQNNWSLVTDAGKDGQSYSITQSTGNGTFTSNELTYTTEASGTPISSSLAVSVTDGQTPQYSGVHSDLLTFTLSCQVKSFDLSFDANSGSFTEGEGVTRQVEYGAAVGALPTPTRTGYQFAGWYTAADGGSEYEETTSMPGANTALYAHWTANTYTVRFDANADWLGSGSMADQPMTYDQAAALSANAFTNTYTDQDKVQFAGWNTAQDGSGTPYKDGESVSNLTADNGGIVTLYAQWEFLHTLTVKYDTSVEDDTTNYESYTAKQWLVPGSSLTWGPKNLLDTVDSDVDKTEKMWNKQWIAPTFPEAVTTGTSATETAADSPLVLDRQWYYFDVNGYISYLDGTTSGGGNLKTDGNHGLTQIAAAQVFINDKDVTPANNYDYFVKHKFGARYNVTISVLKPDEYEYVGASMSTGASTDSTVSGKVRGEVRNPSKDLTAHPEGYYDVTGVTFKFRQVSEGKTSQGEGSSEASDDTSSATGAAETELPGIGAAEITGASDAASLDGGTNQADSNQTGSPEDDAPAESADSSDMPDAGDDSAVVEPSDSSGAETIPATSDDEEADDSANAAAAESLSFPENQQVAQ